MKYLILTVLFLSCAFLQSCNAQSADAETLKTIAAQDSTLIVDVRTVKEYSEGHIENSINIPLDIVYESIPSLKEHKNLIVVCRSGGRAEKAKKILNENGFSNVYNGGGWESLNEILKKGD